MKSPEANGLQSSTVQTPSRSAQAGKVAAAGSGTEEKWAVCCSGGGIRSAAYCLGAMQSLQQGGLLRKARWILGVSGGSYIAASRALVAHDLSVATEDPAGFSPGEPAYAPGTAEERNLRLDTRYIAPNGSTVLAGVLSLLLGAVVTFVIVLAPVYALAHAWGWLLRWQGVAVPAGSHTITADVTALGWWLPSVIMAGITVALFMFWWLTLHPYRIRRAHGNSRQPWWAFLKPDDRDRGAKRARILSWATILTAGLAVAMLAVPPLISWLTRSSGPLGALARAIGFGARPTWSLPALAALIGAVAAVAKYVQGGMAKWNATVGAAKAQGAQQPGVPAQLAGWLRQQLIPWLASAIVVLGGAVLALLWTTDGVRAGFSAAELWPVLIALAVVLFTRIGVNVNRLSMHDFYRWRLADAFAVTRRAAEEQDPVRARVLFDEAAATRLSELRDSGGKTDEPGLVICGTANINAAREVPRGQDGFCMAFDPDHVTLRRERGLKKESARARTSDYEALLGKRRCTLFDVSAISGAAISPLMGAATRHAYRILFTFTNIRLGVWIPHPTCVHDAGELLDRLDRLARTEKIEKGTLRAQLRQLRRLPDEDKDPDHDNDRGWAYRPLLLLLWYLSPHPLWNRQQGRNRWREARLWAHVLDLRRNDRRAGALWYRVLQPTLGLLWAEAAGKLSYRSTWMYVTDGGHYDNLGLVEALHRGADRIVVLDASGDKVDSWFTLGGAIALARADAGVQITLNPTTMCGPRLAVGQVLHPWAHGTFTRPSLDPESSLPRHGEIWVCKLGWWEGAPWDVLAYARSHQNFPCDSTLEQLYDAVEFEAYHQLGVAAALDATEHCEPPLRLGPAPAAGSAPVPGPAPVPAVAGSPHVPAARLAEPLGDGHQLDAMPRDLG
jgi:hypothetical protein